VQALPHVDYTTKVPADATTYYQTVLGSLTPTGAISRSVTLSRTVTGSLTPAGGLAKQTSKFFAGALSPSGAVTKETQKSLAGGTTPSGAVIKQTNKVLNGSVTPSNTTIAKLRLDQATAGSITPTGSLSQIFIEAGAGLYERARRFISHVYRLGRSSRR
jgi:hypothetical protein